MRVLIAADYSSPYGGNFLGSLLDLGEEMRKKGDDLVFLFPKREDGERFWVQCIRDLGYKVFFIDKTSGDENITDDVAAIVLEQKIDIIHSHFGLLYHYFLFDKERLGNTMLLLHDHMGFSHDNNIIKQIVKNNLRALLFKKNKIGIISVMKQKDKSYALNFGRHWYVPNAISYRRCVSQPLSREERRQEKTISSGTELVLVFGWNFEIKGIDVAVNAVRKLRETEPRAELAIVIQNRDISPADVAFVEKKTGIILADTPWIHLWPSTEDVFSYYRAADVFLSSSRTESFSYAILEAISQNCSVVMSDISGTAWAKEYSKTHTFRSENYEECAIRISESLNESLGSNNDEIMKKYAINNWTEQIMAVYDEMMRGKT